ncbi:MAG TPA: hypothetical protein VJI74_00415 [Candidatus Paceibacterota bacterium]
MEGNKGVKHFDAESGKNFDEALKIELEQEGWQRAGHEFVTGTPYNSETGRFETVRVLSDEQIRDKYLKEYGKYGFTEVRIEPAHDPLTGEEHKSGMVFVYLRKQPGK